MKSITFGGFDAYLLEPVRLLHRPDDSLNKLLYLLVQSTDICIFLRGLLVNFHSFDSAVIFGR